MPFVQVKDILDRARRVYLNDPKGSEFKDEILIEYLKTSYDYLQTEFKKNELSVIVSIYRRIVQAGQFTVFQQNPADKLMHGSGPSPGLIPPDFVFPLELRERRANTDDAFTPMVQVFTEPQRFGSPSDTLSFWCFRLDDIKFPVGGAITDREVEVVYLSSFPRISDPRDNVTPNGATYLTAKVAELAHRFISQNFTLADAAGLIAAVELKEVVNSYVKSSQAVPAIPYGFVNTGW